MRRTILATLFILVLAATLTAQERDPDPPARRLIRAARAWVGTPCRYDGSYRAITYPGGDPGGRVGACTDLVVRSYRALGIDLQVLVHEDMKKKFELYPAKKLYDQVKPDPNIDHRRVPNLMAFFNRHAASLTLSLEPDQLEQWQPGDLVVFDLLDNGIPSHLGIVSDQKSDTGLPLVIHHFPPLPTEEDCITRWKIVGHFRYFPERDSGG